MGFQTENHKNSSLRLWMSFSSEALVFILLQYQRYSKHAKAHFQFQNSDSHFAERVFFQFWAFNCSSLFVYLLNGREVGGIVLLNNEPSRYIKSSLCAMRLLIFLSWKVTITLSGLLGSVFVSQTVQNRLETRTVLGELLCMTCEYLQSFQINNYHETVNLFALESNNRTFSFIR